MLEHPVLHAAGHALAAMRSVLVVMVMAISVTVMHMLSRRLLTAIPVFVSMSRLAKGTAALRPGQDVAHCTQEDNQEGEPDGQASGGRARASAMQPVGAVDGETNLVFVLHWCVL